LVGLPGYAPSLTGRKPVVLLSHPSPLFYWRPCGVMLPVL